MPRCFRRFATCSSIVWCVSLAWVAHAAESVHAQTTIVARFGQAAPNGIGTFFDFHKFALNDLGQVAIYASMFDTAPGEWAAVLIGDASGLDVVVRRGQLVPGSDSLKMLVDANANGYHMFLNNRGDLAFSMAFSSGLYYEQPIESGIFIAPRGDGGQLQKVSQTFANGDAGPKRLYPLALTEGGDVIASSSIDDLLEFPGISYGVQALFRANATSLSEVVRTGQAAPTP